MVSRIGGIAAPYVVLLVYLLLSGLLSFVRHENASFFLPCLSPDSLKMFTNACKSSLFKEFLQGSE